MLNDHIDIILDLYRHKVDMTAHTLNKKTLHVINRLQDSRNLNANRVESEACIAPSGKDCENLLVKNLLYDKQAQK